MPPIHRFLETDAASLSFAPHLAVTAVAAGKKIGAATSGRRRRFGDFPFPLGLRV
ncbi:hypothetical protein RGR602_PC02387 (plasmid) [Rhizobium gallicum bv. gallicum R602sp]|uniref:Uncharacterized protein n=1 Tax=Rhizobium gallicum bv. gallicum R602sp TaxID=1041138 RepID=A0A0B4XH45_9HYPH|nr:hypothetical protein RGR602_PC02387 [Rhizobium gallicum bv. gallicum R602sp]